MNREGLERLLVWSTLLAVSLLCWFFVGMAVASVVR